MIPVHLKYQIESLENRLKSSDPGRKKIALFDLDNTLLIGDIGEAVFAQLLADGAPLACTWGEYQSFLQCDATAAYRLVVEAMAGLTHHDVEAATLKVMNSGDSSIQLGRFLVPIPKPHPVMKKFISQLLELGYAIYVISASNQTSVRIAVTDFFNLPAECAFGIESTTVNGCFSSTLVKPYPISAGKAEVYHNYISDVPPLITATDSLIDAPMLEMTDPVGFSIWVGKNRNEFKAVKELIGLRQHLCFVPRPKDYSFRKSVRTLGKQRSNVPEPSIVFAET